MNARVETAGDGNKQVFRPHDIVDAQRETQDLLGSFEVQKANKSTNSLSSLVTQFRSVIDKIPEIFKEEKEFFGRVMEDFAGKLRTEIGPLESQLGAADGQLEGLKTQKAQKMVAIDLRLGVLARELEVLENELVDAASCYDRLLARYDSLASGKAGFGEALRNLLPGRKSKTVEAARVAASGAFDDKREKNTAVRRKKIAISDEKNALEREESEFSREVKRLESDRDKIGSAISAKLGSLYSLFSDWISRLKSDVEYLSKGGRLNSVDIISIDTRSRVNGFRASADGVGSEFGDDLKQLAVYDANQKDLRPLTADPGDKNQSTFEYLRDNEPNSKPALFYTGQILETVNDSVSRRFVGCSLVEVFSPSSRKHVAFHLPPTWITKSFTGERTANFLEYNPLFFYTKLKQFVEDENCDFEDLEVKIVSGVIIPPDQIAASLRAIGVQEGKISVVQLPADNFATLTIAGKRKILINGEEVQFVGDDEKRVPDWQERVFTTVGGRSGRGYGYYATGDAVRFAV